MTIATVYPGQNWIRRFRWAAAGSVVFAAHAGIAIALVELERSKPEDPTGAVEIDLAALAVESPFSQPDLEELPTPEIASPPPQPPTEEPELEPEAQPLEAPATEATEAEPTPADTQPAEMPAQEIPPVETPPELPATEAPHEVPVASENLPELEEAPLAPEPEVTLPKQIEQEQNVETEQEVAAPPLPRKAPSPPPQAKKKPARASTAPQKRAAPSARAKFDPNPTFRAKPNYPSSARSKKIEGYVVVRYSVSPSGSVTSVHVVSSHPAGIFNSATVAAVRQWRFKPPGRTISGRQTTIRFKLR